MTAPLALMFVGDGPRDEATLPPLVAAILATATRSTGFRAWTDIVLQRGSGYARKLKFALREAVDNGSEGLVATVDRDKSPGGSRISDLDRARMQERSDPKSTVAGLPVALGEADPHAEAWLLDDPHAVRTTLGLDGQTAIPNVRKVRPKEALDELCARGRPEEPIVDVLSEIAAAVSVERCAHAKETGLQQFVEDLRREMGNLRRPKND